MLDDISAVKTWDKLNPGMIKMYKGEVLNKLPVMQHFLFGSVLQYTGPLPPTDADFSDPHAGHAHAHPPSGPSSLGAGVNGDLGGAGQSEVGWGDCCGIPVPSAFAAAHAERAKLATNDGELRSVPGLGLMGKGIRPVPFD